MIGIIYSEFYRDKLFLISKSKLLRRQANRCMCTADIRLSLRVFRRKKKVSKRMHKVERVVLYACISHKTHKISFLVDFKPSILSLIMA